MLSGGAVAWSSRKQPVVFLSTTETEFISAAHCGCQTVWMRRVLKRLDCKQGTPIVIHYDNMSIIKLAKNSVMHGRSKYKNIRFHFLRELYKEDVIHKTKLLTLWHYDKSNKDGCIGEAEKFARCMYGIKWVNYLLIKCKGV
jgi:hypothetical protein